LPSCLSYPLQPFSFPQSSPFALSSRLSSIGGSGAGGRKGEYVVEC
jgi:hypothetical protein